jgi:peptide/nickel transport system substrate-binding protein
VRFKRGRVAAAAAVVAVGLALVVTACGGGSSSSSGSKSGVAGASQTSNKTFPLLKVVWGDTDYMDPGLSYRLESWQLFQDIYIGLVTKAHLPGAAGAKVIPGLAQAMPTVNKTGTDYKFTLRKGLEYSNGTPVKASDFKATIIRDFKLNSPGIGFYSNIVGVDACEKNPTKCSAISGIVTDDSAGTVEIKLKQPESDFLYVLSLPFSVPVPPSTPATPQGSGSTAPAADGPYYIANFSPHKSFVIKRNPHWKNNSIPGIPNGNPDVVKGTITDDQSASAQQVISGAADYDENLLPTDRLAQLQKKYSSQIRYYVTPSTYYFFMNMRLKPFSSLKARQAVNYAIDRNQLVKIRGGLAKPTQNFLPPSYPQYKKISYYTYNLAKAKQLVQQSGMKGQPVTVYTISDNQVDKATGEYLQGVLNQIGFKAKVRELAGGNYFTIIGNQATKAQIGFTDWFEDYPYPSDWFNILLNGEHITKIHNNNYGNVDIKPLNKEIDRLDSLPPAEANSPGTNAAWAKVDYAYIVKYAAVAPYYNGLLTSFFSSRMDMKCDIFDDSQDDFAQFCLK